MRRNWFFLIVLFIGSVAAVAEESDVLVVKSILEKCGLENLTVDEVTVLENGRVVTLNLKNRDISKDGAISLPSEIGQLTALRELICSNNIIPDIPPEIGNCSELQKLDLSGNRIVALPPEIGKLKQLTYLDLRHNSLRKITPELGNCSNIEFLWLWGNKLTEINPAITKLRKLKELYLNDNRLSSLPIGIVRMRFKYIDLTGNRLCNLSTILDSWMKKYDSEYRQMQKCL